MNGQDLEIRRRSASMTGETTAQRVLPRVAKYIDTSTCIGCKACEVACQEWNDLPTFETRTDATMQTLPALHPEFWNLIRFAEIETPETGLMWLLRKDNCMHCEEPGCLVACPAPGAIVQYENGIVDVDPARCIGCGYCETGCPFDVPKISSRSKKMAKCTLCVDRVQVGLEPACVKACPTGCLHFGTKADLVGIATARVEELRRDGFASAALYDPPGVGGTNVVTVLAHGDHPEWYGLPRDPHVPRGVRFWKHVLRPLGVVALGAAVVGLFAHFLRYGRREPIPESGVREDGSTVP